MNRAHKRVIVLCVFVFCVTVLLRAQEQPSVEPQKKITTENATRSKSCFRRYRINMWK